MNLAFLTNNENILQYEGLNAYLMMKIYFWLKLSGFEPAAPSRLA